MTDQEKFYLCELRRRNSLRNFMNTVGNLGMGPGAAGSTDEGPGPDPDPEMGSTTVTFFGGETEEFPWKGEISLEDLEEAGITEGGSSWVRYIVRLEIGTDVTGIGASTFAECSSMKFLKIPSSVKYIGNYAFYGCNLSQVAVPKGVGSIGENAFRDTLMGSIVPTTGMAPVPDALAFDDRTYGEIRAMDNYPWGIEQEEDGLS